MPAVAASRSRGCQMTSVRPPLVSVISLNTRTLTASSRPVPRDGVLRPRRRDRWRRVARRHRRRHARRRAASSRNRKRERRRPALVRHGEPRAPIGRRLGHRIDADRVDQHFALANQPLQLFDPRVAARVVAVGDDEQRLLPVAPGGGERNRFRDRVVQRRRAARLDAPQLRGDLFLVPSSRDAPARAGCRTGRGTLRRLLPSSSNRNRWSACLRGDQLVAFHAAAGVEDDAEADRDALRGEVRDRPQLAVLVDPEIVLTEAGDEPASPVTHGRGDVDQLDPGAEAELLPLAGGGPLLRGHRHQRHDDGRGDESGGALH